VCLTALCGGGRFAGRPCTLDKGDAVAFTVEDQKQLRAAVARTPEMLGALNAARSPAPGGGSGDEPSGSLALWQMRESEISRGVRFPLQDVLRITEDQVPDDVPDVPSDESSPFVTGYGSPQHLYRWVRASGATKKHSRDNDRARARSWARYRDAVAPAAIAEWNVLVRRWAGAYTPARAAQPTRSEPDVVPVALNL